MLGALIVVLSFISKRAQTAAAILGGIGFGTFIDEVGKFVTSDNDYFFRPAVAIIYVIFILIFLAGRAIHASQNYSAPEYLINALQEMEDVVLHHLDEEERNKTLKYLAHADKADPLVAALESALLQKQLIPPPPATIFERGQSLIKSIYVCAAASRWFHLAVIFFFVGQLLLKLTYVFVLIFLFGLEWRQILDVRVLGAIGARMGRLSFIDVAELASSLFAGAFVLWGVLRLRRSRLRAFVNFERSILVSIFLTQVFVFYQEQLHALVGLAFNLAVLVALRYMINRERGDGAADSYVE
ncbi:MAG: hypothetical protein WKF30_17115 [Pyrinomonadaceae bacterium]